jgi:phage shock protein A
MTTHDPVIQDLQRTIDQLRADKDEWRNVAQSALQQVETWKKFADAWKELYELSVGKKP